MRIALEVRNSASIADEKFSTSVALLPQASAIISYPQLGFTFFCLDYTAAALFLTQQVRILCSLRGKLLPGIVHYLYSHVAATLPFVNLT